jgi:hypothetical protein
MLYVAYSVATGKLLSRREIYDNKNIILDIRLSYKNNRYSRSSLYLGIDTIYTTNEDYVNTPIQIIAAELFYYITTEAYKTCWFTNSKCLFSYQYDEEICNQLCRLEIPYHNVITDFMKLWFFLPQFRNDGLKGYSIEYIYNVLVMNHALGDLSIYSDETIEEMYNHLKSYKNDYFKKKIDKLYGNILEH